MKSNAKKFPLEPKINWWRLPEEVETLSKIVGNIEIGVGSQQTLQEVTDQDNTTTNNIQLTDTAKVTFDNGSRLQKGTTNSYNGGNGGIAQVCSIDYELKWEAGRQYVLQQDGFTIREVKYNFTLTPGVNDDFTRGFVTSSRWILDNGDIYLCTDSTEGAAVWELQSFADSRPYKVYTALVSQLGENAPTAIVLENTIGGTFTYSYGGAGIYPFIVTGTFTPFNLDKTAVFISGQAFGVGFGTVTTAKIQTANGGSILTQQSNGGIDNYLIKTSIEIRVYN